MRAIGEILRASKGNSLEAKMTASGQKLPSIFPHGTSAYHPTAVVNSSKAAIADLMSVCKGIAVMIPNVHLRQFLAMKRHQNICTDYYIYGSS
jgi:hypothetical protein